MTSAAVITAVKPYVIAMITASTVPAAGVLSKYVLVTSQRSKS